MEADMSEGTSHERMTRKNVLDESTDVDLAAPTRVDPNAATGVDPATATGVDAATPTGVDPATPTGVDLSAPTKVRGRSAEPPDDASTAEIRVDRRITAQKLGRIEMPDPALLGEPVKNTSEKPSGMRFGKIEPDAVREAARRAGYIPDPKKRRRAWLVALGAFALCALIATVAIRALPDSHQTAASGLPNAPEMAPAPHAAPPSTVSPAVPAASAKESPPPSAVPAASSAPSASPPPIRPLPSPSTRAVHPGKVPAPVPSSSSSQGLFFPASGP